MSGLRFLTSGESHGQCLTTIVEGMVAGLPLKPEVIDHELERRQLGYGRGGRMQIEKDKVEILSGVRSGETIGGPIALQIRNKDFKINELPVVKRPRPGHADLIGVLKYGRSDVRDILERASARETAARVAAGSVCREFLKAFGVEIFSHVVEIGGVKAKADAGMDFDKARKAAEKSPVRCVDGEAEARMIERIDSVKASRDTVGGVFEVRAKGVVPGIGSFAQYDRRLNARLGAALLSIQAVKAFGVGIGFDVAHTDGSGAHDEIFYDTKKKKYRRETNHAGGIEGGMSNGEEIILRAATKPYATLMKPLRSVHIDSKAVDKATVERSDVTAVPACGVVGEAMTAYELARGYLEKFGGDSLEETRRNYEAYLERLSKA